MTQDVFQEGLKKIVIDMDENELKNYILRINQMYLDKKYIQSKLELLQHIASTLHQAAKSLEPDTRKQIKLADTLKCSGHARKRTGTHSSKIRFLEDWIETCHKNYKEREQQQRK